MISSLVNITDFTLYKFMYLIFTKPKLLSWFSLSIVQGFPFYLMSCTASLQHSNLQPCLCLSMVLQTALKCFILLHPLYFLPYTGYSLYGCHVPQYLQLSTIFSHFHYSFIVYYYHISACLFLLIQTFSHLLYFLLLCFHHLSHL